MNIRFFKAAGRYAFIAMTSLVLSLSLCGCETRDDRSDCTVEMSFRFEYILNKNTTDLFGDKGEIVDLYIYDAKGRFVKSVQAARSAGTLGSDNRVVVALPHGKYTVVAWANRHDHCYDCVYDGAVQEQRVSLKTTGGQAPAALADLMHGRAQITANNASAAEETVISLTKNTNKVAVVLNTKGNLSPLGNDAFIVGMKGSNGVYKFDNSPAECSLLDYIPKYTRPSSNVFKAEFNVLRLLTGDDMELSVKRNDGTRAGITLPMSISLTAELLRHPSYNSDDDLDRYDDYVLEYEIDLSNENAPTVVLVKINDWKVVGQGGNL